VAVRSGARTKGAYVSRLISLPLRFSAGLLAGMVGKKLFRRLWGLIDEQEPPKAGRRGISVPKLALGLGIEGALLRVLRGLADHSARGAFARLTGSWPGEQPNQSSARHVDEAAPSSEL
jgi:Protein of unknown function (DUF4235)